MAATDSLRSRYSVSAASAVASACSGKPLGRPPTRPRARAAVSPAWVRSRISSRSNSASVANRLNTPHLDGCAEGAGGGSRRFSAGGRAYPPPRGASSRPPGAKRPEDRMGGRHVPANYSRPFRAACFSLMGAGWPPLGASMVGGCPAAGWPRFAPRLRGGRIYPQLRRENYRVYIYR